jgi:hypothetical protein
MKSQYLRILMALVGFVGFAVTAKAQALDRIVVTIPFEFVAGGQTLPAGTYTVKRLSDHLALRTLVLSSFENRANAIVFPVETKGSRGGDAHLRFDIAGDQHFLSQIETGEYVYSIPVSRAAILLASAKSHTGTVSGSSAGSK